MHLFRLFIGWPIFERWQRQMRFYFSRNNINYRSHVCLIVQFVCSIETHLKLKKNRIDQNRVNFKVWSVQQCSCCSAKIERKSLFFRRNRKLGRQIMVIQSIRKEHMFTAETKLQQKSMFTTQTTKKIQKNKKKYYNN